METSSFRPESHVAQRNRRDKLRLFQQGSASPSVHHLDDFHGNLEQLSVHQVGLSSDLLQASNVRNGIELSDSLYSSGMVDFDALSAQRDVVVDPHGLGALQPNRQMTAEDSSFGSMSSPVLSNFSASTKTCSGDPPQGCNNWTNLDSQPNYDWMVNYASGSVGGESNQRTTFIGEVVLSNNARLSNISTSAQHLKPVGYQIHQSVDLQSPLVSASGEITTGQDRQKQVREMNFASRGLYQSSLQQQVTVASYGGNERVLLPPYGNQSVHFDDVNVWVNRPVQDCHQWSGEGSLARKSDQELKNVGGDAHTQGLSLSLSSNPPSKLNVTQCGGLREADEDSKVAKSNHPSPAGMPSIISNKACGRSLHDLVGTSTYVLRNTGPLGPFTGYATILKSSRFLKPAQELLDEYCKGTSLKLMRVSEASERVSGEASASASADAVNAGADTEAGAKGNNNSGVSSSTLYSSNEGSGDGGVGSSSCESYRLEYQQKKAKLLYLQEEVCRKYKQYHQQMQMVASAFETVAGLSASTPYISLAFKTVSRNFRCLRHAISDQLKDVTIRALGEDLPSPNTVASSSKGDTITSRLAYMDQSFQKQKSSGSNIGFLDPPQPVWRPQRGLPERSVAILRAWLFDHFLHPYPTDTDKNMLAAQTGLSRNQVSNWFINARVRVWKPMVEEIHMLETKGSAETNQSGTKNDGNSNSAVDNSTVPLDAEPQPSKPATSSVHSRQLQCCGSGTGSSMGSAEQLNAGQWNQQKRSRFDEFQVPSSVDGSLMSYLPCQRSGIDIGGLGAVSLTLGLRHSVENAQQQHQQQMQQHHEDQLRRQFGGQMIHDFVG